MMVKPNLDDLPAEVDLPPGYAIRAYQPGGETAWAYIVSRTIGGSSDPDRSGAS